MRCLVLLAFSAFGACLDEGWVLPESEAIDIVRAEMSARGVEAGDTTRHTDPINLCVAPSPCRTVTVALDGWDDEARVGFAYITPAERPGQPRDVAIEGDEARALQATLDARTATEGIVLVFRQWGHETDYLARNQFTGAVRGALDAHGL